MNLAHQISDLVEDINTSNELETDTEKDVEEAEKVPLLNEKSKNKMLKKILSKKHHPDYEKVSLSNLLRKHFHMIAVHF